LRNFEAFAALQSIVGAVGACAFHFLLIADDFEPPGAMLEGVEPRCAGMAFLEVANFTFDRSSVLDTAQ
jgi:hypothetical protein